MRRTRLTILSALLPAIFICNHVKAQSDEHLVEMINSYGKLNQWSVREVEESKLIGGQTKYLYEFYGSPTDTLRGNHPYSAPENYYWRSNNVMANILGIVKASVTDFPEKRSEGDWCVRIETHIETVRALGINMEVTCQGAFLLGALPEPIRDTKNPMEKPLYGMPFSSRPKALIYDYKAEVGHEAIRGTGFSRLKNMGYPDYPCAICILQKRWETEKGEIHALRVGTGNRLFTENQSDWVNGYRQEIYYGDITSEPFFREEMDLITGEKTLHAINSKGKNVEVKEVGWASADETPNCLVIYFIASSGVAFYGGVGNILWLDNIHLEM